jgi:hypothetical protein
MNGLCSEPLSWEKTAQLIQEGTVESLGQLGRSESQLSVYRKFMAGVRIKDNDQGVRQAPRRPQ